MSDERRQHVERLLRQNLPLTHLDDGQSAALAGAVCDLADASWMDDDRALHVVLPVLNQGLQQARDFEVALQRIGTSVQPLEASDE